MFAPDDIDYSRLDVTAMLQMRGIAVVDDLRQAPCQRWLAQHGYDLSSVDFGRPFAEILAQLGSLFNWMEQFGYSFDNGEGNLNALADGFSFPFSQQRGRVLVVNSPNALATSHPGWFDAFLEIASDHSLLHLACGSRFFVLLVVPRESNLVGRVYCQSKIPIAYWNPNARRHGFVE
jgi:hypothetical protein